MKPLMRFSYILVIAAGCNVNVPFDPADVVRPIDEAIDEAQQAIEGAIADPLGAKPFPVLVGGDGERVYYATSLTDVRLNFPGITSDVVIPSFGGPSNLYKFEDKERSLVRPLIPAGSFFDMTTDGRFVAYFAVPDIDTLSFELRVLDLDFDTESVLFVNSQDEFVLPSILSLQLDGGRIAFVIFDSAAQTMRLHVEDLLSVDPAIEIETSSNFWSFSLRGDRLAYAAGDYGGPKQVVLRDLATDAVEIVAEGIRVGPTEDDFKVFQGANSVIWTESGSTAGETRVMHYDVPTGVTRVWAESLQGNLAGVSDDYLITEETVFRTPRQSDQIVIRRYDAAGKVKKLATFQAGGFAGQTTVFGDRVSWVNPERKIVVMPLAGGDRIIFRPF